MSAARCVIPDLWHGVKMSHSDDLVTIFHGSTEPVTACGFCVRYYLPEAYRAYREGQS
jgi:hypothetical protein